MPENKTKPTKVSTASFLEMVPEKRRNDSQALIAIMKEISSEKPVMWGPSIIGFGSQHYKYETGREGDMPRLAFSPRKAAITVYFNEGFGRYGALLKKLGKHKASVSCLYIAALADIDLDVLREMLERSYASGAAPQEKPASVDEYIERVPASARVYFDELRALVRDVLPKADEVLSYGVVGYKVDEKRARVFISGWKDHVAMYPVPKDESLQHELKPYQRSKGTLWFPLDAPLPNALLRKVVKALAS